MLGILVAELGLVGLSWSDRKQSVNGRAAGDTCGTSGTDGPCLYGFAIRDCDYFPRAFVPLDSLLLLLLLLRLALTMRNFDRDAKR